MIDEEETFRRFGYYSEDLTPKSNKKIVARCDDCGKIRELKKEDYRDLCQSCSSSGKRHHLYGKFHSDETKEKMRLSHLNRFEGKNHPSYGPHRSEETRFKMSKSHIGIFVGEKAPAWKGGISFEPYCIKFNNEFKEKVRIFFDRKCYVCGKNEIENKAKLCVHHVAYNKDTCCDNSEPLFVPLCRGCHAKTNINRKEWEEFFMISLKYLTNGKCF